jgi:hypothetical protein
MSLLIAGLGIWLGVFFGEVHADDASGGSPEDRLCADVQKTLDIPGAGRGVLDALELVFAGADDKPQADRQAKQFDDFEAFATTLLPGSQPNTLEFASLDIINVSNRYSVLVPPRWRYGDWAQREQLVRRLWEHAKAVRTKNALAASRAAKAALLLTAQDCFRMQASLLGLLRDPQCAALTNTDPALVQALIDEVTPAHDSGAGRMHRVESIGAPLNYCIESEKVDEEYARQAALIVTGFRGGWQNAMTRDERWEMTNLMWRFVCLSRANHDEKSVTDVTIVVHELLPQTTDKYAKRWLGETLTVPGDRPKSSGVKFYHDPNQTKPGRGP